MLNLGTVKIPLCDGVSRRSFLQVGSAGLAGLSLPTLMQLQAAGAVDASSGQDQELHHDLPRRLARASRHLGHEARRPGRSPRQVQADQHQRARHADLRALPADGPDDGQGGPDPQPAPQHRRDARERPALDDDRPRLQRRQHASRTCGSVISRVFGPKSELPANVILPGPIGNTGAGPLHGQTAGLPRQRPRAVLPQRRSGPARFQGRRPGSRRKGSREFRLDARQKLLGQLDDLQRRTETRSTQMHDSAYDRAFRLLTSPEAKEAFDLTQGARQAPRPLRPQHVRPKLPDGPPADRRRRPLRHGQPLRHGLQPHLLGHARRRRRPEQHLPRLRAAPLPAVRPGLHRPDRRPGAARPAAGDGRRRAERVRPHAADQRPRRPRPLSRRLDELPRAAATSAAAR